MRFPLASGTVCRKIIVVGDPESVQHRLPAFDVRTEGDAFDLGGNLAGVDFVIGEELNEIEEERLADGIGGGGCAVHVADVDGDEDAASVIGKAQLRSGVD